MKIIDELKRITRPYEDPAVDETEEDEEELEEAAPSLDEARKRTAERPADLLSDSAPFSVTPTVKPLSSGATRSIRSGTESGVDGKVVSMSNGSQLKVVLVKPTQFEEASTIADHLRDKRTVVLNLESTNRETARRLLDFLSGVAYALEGKIRKVAQATYIITPYNVDFVGDLLDELERNSRGYF